MIWCHEHSIFGNLYGGVKMAIYDNRICRDCGCIFSGGPRSWYCEKCRAERRKEAHTKHVNRKKMGLSVKIGSTKNAKSVVLNMLLILHVSVSVLIVQKLT